jgi:hypothetical protein
MLSYEYAQKLDSGVAYAAPDDALFPSFPRKREPSRVRLAGAKTLKLDSGPAYAGLDAGSFRRSPRKREPSGVGHAVELFAKTLDPRFRGDGGSVPRIRFQSPRRFAWRDGEDGWLARRPLSPAQGIDMSRVGLRGRLAIRRRSPRYAWGPSSGTRTVTSSRSSPGRSRSRIPASNRASGAQNRRLQPYLRSPSPGS